MIIRNGFSLIELLCTLVIGLFSVLISAELYSHFKRSSAVEQELSDIQENSRFAVYILRTTIEKAGLIGSARLSDRFPVINRGVNENRVISYKNHIMVLRGTDSEVKKFNIIPKSDSNVIVVRSMSSISNRLLKLKKDHLVVEHNPKFQEGDDIIISDHLHAVLAHVRAISLKESSQYLLLSKKIEEKFNETAEVGKLETIVFFVGETARKNRFGDPIAALYMVGVNGRRVELISNVIDLKVKCLKKIDHRLQINLPEEVGCWPFVNGLQIDLLLRSNDMVLDGPKNYRFQRHIFRSHDRYLYKGFRIIIPLREH